MKVCERCGEEIATKDGDNLCESCEALDIESDRGHGFKHISAKHVRRNKLRRERDQMMRDLGMVKVRGALGGTYWE